MFVSSAAIAPPAATGLAQAGCVVLAAAAALPDVAKAWAEERELRTLLVHEPLQALASLCLLERAQLARAAWGLQRIDSIGLLILEPDHGGDLPRLLAAVRRYLPAITIHALHGQAIASASNTAESVALQPGENCDDSRHVFSSEKGASLLATASTESPRPRTTIQPSLPEQLDVASAAPVHGEQHAAQSGTAVARWPVDVAEHEQPTLEPDEPLRITRDEIAMLLDDHSEIGTP